MLVLLRMSAYLTNSARQFWLNLALSDADILSKTSIEYPIGWCGYNYTNSVYIEFDGDHLQKAYLLKR